MRINVGKRTMKFSVLCAVLLFASCADLSAYRYHNTYMMVKPVKNYDKRYSDADMAFRFDIKPKKIESYITNSSGNDVSIDWPGAEFIDSNGKPHKIANIETIFTKKQDRISAKVISSGATDVNVIVPVEYVTNLEEQWMWSLKPLFDLESDKALSNRGKTFTLVLPLILEGGEKRTYQFEFAVASVLPHRPQNPR